VLFKDKLYPHNEVYIEQMYREFNEELIATYNFGYVWPFNGMKLDFRPEAGWPQKVVDDLQASIRGAIDDLLSIGIEELVVGCEYSSAVSELYKRTGPLYQLLESSNFQDGGSEYSDAAIQHVGVRLLFWLIVFEKICNYLQERRAPRRISELVAVAVPAFGHAFRAAAGRDFGQRLQRAFPMVSKRFLALGIFACR